MKNNAKKLIVLVLAVSLITGLAAPSVATESNPAIDKSVYAVHGTDAQSAKLYTRTTEFENIKESVDGCYALEVNLPTETVTVPIGRLDVDLMDNTQFNDVMGRNDIATEIKVGLEAKRAHAISNGWKTLPVTIFSQLLLPSYNMTRSGSDHSTYLEYNGVPMRSDFVYSTGLNTNAQTIETGVNTRTVASGVSDVILFSVGLINMPLAILAGGISLLKGFINAYGENFATGSREDFFHLGMEYDDVDQYTFAQIGNKWLLGLCTERVTITRIYSQQYYYNAQQRHGETYSSDKSTNTVIASKHFEEPWATAWQWVGNTQTEFISWKVGNKTFTF